MKILVFVVILLFGLSSRGVTQDLPSFAFIRVDLPAAGTHAGRPVYRQVDLPAAGTQAGLRATPLTGNLRLDLSASISLRTPSFELSTPKSPLTAALLSAAIPGLGQSYAQDWTLSWKSLAFLGAEAVLWTAYAINTSKADKQTTEFQRFADEHWSVVQYADWIGQNIGQLNPQVNPNNIVTSLDPSLSPWERVDWAELNRVEEEIGRVTGTGFTHRLPHRPEQQYYELIGKYAQFGGGWDDAAGFTPSDLLADRLSARFLAYSRMRGRANDLYNVATAVSTVIVINHLLSALEAAWSTAQANRRISAEAKVKEIRMGGRVEKYASMEASLRF